MDGSRPRVGASLTEVLAHFGVRGMKWGVRRRSSTVPSSSDATRVAGIKTTARKGGTKALSNKDLQDAVLRMGLEKQYKALAPTASQRAGKFVSEILLGVGKQQATKIASDVTAKQIGDLLKK